MTNINDVLQDFEATIDTYIAELEKLNLENLLIKTNEEEWSIGQMYMHLIQSALFLHLNHVDQCLADSDSAVDSGAIKTELGEDVFERKSFPPIRIKVPASPQYTPQQPVTKAQVLEGLYTVKKRMERTASVLNEQPASKKVFHPSFGALNAQEWFLLIEMHYRHHFLQLDRLKSQLGNIKGA